MAGATAGINADILKRVDKLFTDMYLGEGTGDPPMTVRVDRLEQCQEETTKNSRQTKQMMMATMLSVLGSIATAFLMYKLGIRV